MLLTLLAQTQSFWQLVGSSAVEIAVVVLTPLLVVLVRRLLRLLEDKTNMELAEKHELLVDELVRKGISYAEEQANKALKAGKPINSDDKKSAAVKMVMDQLEEMNLHRTAAEKIAEKVESRLNDERNKNSSK